MQMSKPEGLVVSDKVATDRKMKVHQEIIVVKSALVMNFYKEAKASNLPKDSRKKIEVPYNLMASLHTLKNTQDIDFISRIDLMNKMFVDVDELGENIYQRGVRAVMSTEAKDAFVDVKGQNIELQQQAADHYLTSVLSTVYRLPPFDFETIDGYSFLNIRNTGKILHYPSLNMYVVATASTLIEMVFLYGYTDTESNLNEMIITALQATQGNQPKCYDQMLIPSFSINQVNEAYEMKGVFNGIHLESGCQSASIELISGLSANKGIVLNNSSQIQKLDQSFIFAINDENLKKNNLKNSVILCAEVTRDNWIKL